MSTRRQRREARARRRRRTVGVSAAVIAVVTLGGGAVTLAGALGEPPRPASVSTAAAAPTTAQGKVVAASNQPSSCDVSAGNVAGAQYSDVAHVTGTYDYTPAEGSGGEGANCVNPADSPEIQLDVDFVGTTGGCTGVGDGGFNGTGEADVASDVADGTVTTGPPDRHPFDIGWVVPLKPAGGCVGTGGTGSGSLYAIQASLNNATKSGKRSLEVVKEHTTVSYSGATGGEVGTTLALDADVEDLDGSSFIDDLYGDPNLVGTEKLRFTLYQPDGVTQVGAPVLADVDASGHAEGSPTMTLPGTAGTYKMKTEYLGNGYYHGDDEQFAAIAVTGADPVVTYSVVFGSPLTQTGDSTGLLAEAQTGRTVPVKVEIVGSDSSEITGGSGHTVALSAARSSCGDFGTIDTATTYATGQANTGLEFRWDEVDGHWIYNLDTSLLPGAAPGMCYELDVLLDGEVVGTFEIVLTR